MPDIITPVQARASEGAAARMLFDAMVHVRWNHPRDPVLSAYMGAVQVVDGWPKFRRDWMNQLKAVRGYGPGSIADRITGHRQELMARLGWLLIKKRLRAWSIARCGRPLSARQIVGCYERTYVPPAKRPALIDSTFQIERRNPSPGTPDGFRGSATKREGTLPEICSDIYDRNVRENTLAMIEREWGNGEGARN